MPSFPTELTSLSSVIEANAIESNQEDLEILPSRSEVLACQISSWYPTFSKLPPQNALQRKSVIFRTVIIDLPDDFKDFLLADGVQLPEGTKASTCLSNETQSWSSESENGVGDTAEPSTERIFSFPDLNEKIQLAIDEMGGEVFPKLNWSAPRDATWMNGGRMSCSTPGDVYLLIKSSDFCSYDVNQALHAVSTEEDCTESDFQLQLALRKFFTIHPQQEFRCFVKSRKLIAISQRQASQHYPQLSDDMERYVDLLCDFFDSVLRDELSLPENFVFDAYLDRKERVWLVDVNVWASRTDSLLFSWEELCTINSYDGVPSVRIVGSDKEVRVDPLASYRAPIDVVKMAGSGEFEEFMRQCRSPSVLDEEEAQRQRLQMETFDENRTKKTL